MAKIGWIGLGQMGTPMATHLLQDNSLMVYNRTSAKAKPLVEQGATLAQSVPELLTNSDVIFLMVTDFYAIESIIDEDFLSHISDKTLINMSTIAPAESRTVSTWITEHNGQYVEAPVSGSVFAAESGSLLILTAGTESIVNGLEPLWQALGTYKYSGSIGNGTALKLVLNALLGMFGEAYSEAILLGEAFGLSKQAILDTISESVIGTPFFEYKKTLFASEKFDPQSMLKHITKDMNLIQGFMQQSHLNLPVVHKDVTIYNKTSSNEDSNLDMTVVYQYLKDMKASE